MLSAEQSEKQREFASFVSLKIAPYADEYDRDQMIPASAIGSMAAEGYLGALVPKEYGGSQMDMVTYGLLNQEVGRGCSSLRSLLTVHGMVTHSISRWGSAAQKSYWLPRLASGELIGAFALSEPEAGSDAANIQTTASSVATGYTLDGVKRWITFGQIANVFLVFAKCDSKPGAFLVDRRSDGFSTVPITGMLGVRGSMLAECNLSNCSVPKDSLLGRLGFGLSHVGYSALDLGRYSVACGCVGIARACVDCCLSYASERVQFGKQLREHQLVRQMITRMVTRLKAAELLCYNAGLLRQSSDPRSIMETAIAKYYASVSATETALDAVQILGAAGCSSRYPVQRYLRDAKVMEVIEGSTQIQEITISDYAFQEFGPSNKPDGTAPEFT